MLGQRTDRPRRCRGTALTLACALVVTAVQLLGTTPARAALCADPQNAPVVVGGFEIDGNLCQNDLANREWDVAGPQPVAADPLTEGSTSDTTAFSGGASEANGPNWSVGQTSGNTVPPGQGATDVGNVYASTQTVGDDVLAYFGFQVRGGGGEAAVHVELNVKPNDDPSCAPANRGVPSPCRTAGDVLLAFDKSGSSPMTLAVAWRWTGSTWSAIPVAGVAVGRANSATVTNLAGRALTAGQFGEVAVDLTALFGTAGCSGDYGTINVRTSASTSLTSNLIDWVHPIELSVPSTCPTVILQKRWVNGAEGDTADLSIEPATTSSGSATSTADGAPDVTDTVNRASATVEPGSSVTVSEALGGANTGTYTSAVACGGVLASTPGTTGSFTVPDDADAGTTIVCTFTNTRTQATVRLTKVWAPGSIAGDQATLTIATTGGVTGPATSAAPGSTTIERVAFSGDPVTVGEGWGEANTSSYDATTECSGVDDFDAGDFGASFTVPPVPTDIVCTITNTPVPVEVTLSKSWVNGAPDDTAALTITGGVTDTAVATVPAGGDGLSEDAARVVSVAGATLTLEEVLPAPAQTNTGTYQPVALECNGDPVTFVVTSTGARATLTVPTAGPVNCVFTNEARYQVQLTKAWDANARTGDTAMLTVANPIMREVDTVTATAPDPPGQPASVVAAPGEPIELSETLSDGDAYTADIHCTDEVVPERTGEASATFTVPPDLPAGTITCTFANAARYTVLLTKAWTGDVVAGDSSELRIANTTDDAEDTATATAPEPPSAPAAVAAGAGDSISLSETPAPGNAPYDVSLSCRPTTFSARVTGTIGEFQVPYDLPAGTTFTCTFTNTARSRPPVPPGVSTPLVRTATSDRRVRPGRPFHDRVHVSRLAPGTRATAVARLYGPFASRASASCEPRFLARTHTMGLTNGWTRTPSVRVRAPGYYTWRVTVLAGARHRAATHPCGQPAETTVVAKRPYGSPAVIGGFSGVLASALERRAPAVIRLPAIRLAAPVDRERLVRGRMTLPRDVGAVGWLRRSAGVGDKIGKAVIGGHVSDWHDRPGALHRLSRAKPGQLVTVTRAGLVLRYRVVRKATFDRDRPLPRRYFATTGPHRLVLISCTRRVVHANGRFHYTRYVVVVARPVTGR